MAIKGGCAGAFFAAWLLIASPTKADPQAAATALFAAPTVAERSAAVDELENADPKDPVVPYALGATQFFQALEGLAMALNRHGFETPQSFALPLLRLPVPPREEPEPLTYDGFRTMLVDFRDGMEAAAATLDSVPADAEIGLVVDLARLGIDLDGDGVIGPAESLAAIMAAMRGPGAELTSPPAGRPGVSLRPRRRVLAAGLCQLPGRPGRLLAGARLPGAFDGSFHMLFPRAGLPLQDALVPPSEQLAAAC